MKEMVGGCCVCSDERGWPDNPLVYCDGNGCTVAVHQACYGIVTVPTGPWFCRKCESPERQAKVRCELCPSRSGALKKTDTGGWAHVVCALYIPEVRFGNVTSMEPIILQLIPQERFNKTCYICHDLGKVNRSTIGACMQCNKPGCKQQFHVTCAQGLGLLCEEAGNYLDNVKYCGYCQHHYSKLKKGGNVKTIPPYKPISADSQSSDSSPEKDGEVSPPSAGNIVPSGTSSNPLKGSISKMQSSRSKSTGYQSTSSKNGQSTIKTPVSSTSPSMASTSAPSPSTSAGAPSNIKSTGKGPLSKARGNKSHHDKSSGGKKATSPNDQPAGSTPTNQPEQVSPVLPTGYQVQASAIQETGQSGKGSAHGSSHIQPTSSKPVSSQQAPNTPAAKNSPTEGASAVPTSSSTIILASSSSSDMSSSPILPMNQKFTSSNFTEALITNSDSIFGGVPAEQKQTKKRKAIAQQASASASATYPHTNTASAPQVTDTGRSSGAWDTGHNNQPSVEHTPDSTNDKIKKIKTELPKVSVSQSSHQGSIQHEEMQPPSSHYTSTIQALPGSSGMSSNIQHAPSQHDRPGMSTSNIHYGPSSSHSQAIPTSSHIQGPKYSPSVGAEAHSLQQENPTSLLVSVPLNQGLNLTQQHLTNVDLPPPTRTARSPLIRMGNPMATAWNPPSQPGPSSSEQPSTSGEPKHSSMDKIPTVLSSTTRASVPPNVASGIIRNKKRAAMNPPSNIDTVQSVKMKGKTDSTVLPQLFTENNIVVEDSPPVSPGADTRMKFARLERAPHMLGNELNPESAAAARLSEQLSAELAAHSVYHATPAPILVPPPLINRATNCTGVPRPIGSFANVPSGAQSLDQLLERQWEQGSQFLMEQAQHFDIASLLSCLHQLRTENVRLEEHVSNLLQRRDHLLAVNARLAIPLNTAVAGAATVENRVVRETGGSVRSSPVIRTETSVLTERPQQDILQYFHQRTPQGS